MSKGKGKSKGPASEKPVVRNAGMPKRGKTPGPVPALLDALKDKVSQCFLHGPYSEISCPKCGSIDSTDPAMRMKRSQPMSTDRDKEGTPATGLSGEFDQDKAIKLLKGIGIAAQPVQILKVNCTSKDTLPLTAFDDFQHGFKHLTEINEGKLMKEIKELGFLEPITVWKHGKKNFIMNGHQRVKVLRKMHAMNSLEVKGEIPVTYIEATDMENARKVCLSLASNFGRTSRKGLAEFLDKSDITDQELQTSFSFPDLELEDFKRKVEDDKANAETEEKEKPRGVCFKCGAKALLAKFKV